MKSNKEIVYEFVKEYSLGFASDQVPTLTTKYLSEKLNMQRSNLSSLLNQLVKEGLLEKSSGRPVYYRLKSLPQEVKHNFENLIGYQYSLKEPIMLAKAAVLYPDKERSILLMGASGSGIKYFAREIYEFAVYSKILKKDAPFILFDCKAFIEKPHQIPEALFGSHQQKGALHEACEGILFIKNADLLLGYDRTILFSMLDGNYKLVSQYVNISPNFKTNIICSLSQNVQLETLNLFRKKTNFFIQLPSLNQRTISERWELIQEFFKKESHKLNQVLEVNSAILHCLMLYQTPDNIRGLKSDIHSACANAYVRECQSNSPSLHLLLTDFPNYVRKGLIYYKEYKNELNIIIPDECRYAFKQDVVLRNHGENKDTSIHSMIDKKRKLLSLNQVLQEEIDYVLSADLIDNFQKYYQQLLEKVNTKEQLSRIVSKKLINFVENFILAYQKQFHCEFESHLLYALCIHLNSMMVHVSKRQTLSNQDIQYFIETYENQYNYVQDFCKKIEKEFHIILKQDEIIFILLFMLQKQKEDSQVTILIAMHGQGCASSIVRVVNRMMPNANTHAFDLLLDQNIEEAYDELKQTVISIDKGKGILLIYDMGSLRTMVESIACETHIPIKYLQMPITLIAMSGAKAAMENKSLDNIYELLQQNFQNLQYVRPQEQKVILILSKESLNRALEIKEYIELHYQMKGYKLIALYTNSRLELFGEIDKLHQQYTICGIIGDENPQLQQYPYVSDTKIYKAQIQNVIELFDQKSISDEEELLEVLSYLDGQLEIVDIDEISMMLIEFVYQLESVMKVTIVIDQKIGLLVHIACLIDGLLKGKTQNVHFYVTDIMNEFGYLIESIKDILQPLERYYGINIKDTDIATIISIVLNKQEKVG